MQIEILINHKFTLPKNVTNNEVYEWLLVYVMANIIFNFCPELIISIQTSNERLCFVTCTELEVKQLRIRSNRPI
jgi:hypothetical protein